MRITRSKSRAQGLDTLSEGSSVPATPAKVEAQEAINTSDTRITPKPLGSMAPLETLEPEADHGQSDRFQFPEWATWAMDLDVECKKLCVNIQKLARMQARAREIRTILGQPEARTIVNLIDELDRLESDPLRTELESAMDSLHAAKREFDSIFEKLYPAVRQFDLAKRLMENFGLGVAPITTSRGDSQKTPTVAPSTASVTSPAAGVGCESVPVEPSAARPATTPATTAAPDSSALSPSPKSARAWEIEFKRLMALQFPRPKPHPQPQGESKELAKYSSKQNRVEKLPKGSAAPSSQSSLTDAKEHSTQPILHSKSGEGLAVSDGVNSQLEQADKMSDKARGTQSETDSNDETGDSQDDIDEEKPCEPVYNQQPGETSYWAQVRYINEFQEYQNKLAAYQKRTEGRLARKLERGSEKPSEKPSTPAKRPRRA